MYLITYANENYYDRQKDISEEVSKYTNWKHLSYTESWFKASDFYKDNITILQKKRGAGYWLWKSYIILQTMYNIEENEWCLYLDCGDQLEINNLCNQYINFLRNTTYELIVVPGVFKQSEWTKRDCFVLMNCDKEPFWSVNQLEAGIIFIKNTNFAFKIMTEWLQFCCNSACLTDDNNVCGKPNFESFKDHRHDQSILTNLVYKHMCDKILIDNSPRKFITCNVY